MYIVDCRLLVKQDKSHEGMNNTHSLTLRQIFVAQTKQIQKIVYMSVTRHLKPVSAIANQFFILINWLGVQSTL